MHRQAGESDLNGDIDAFAIRTGLNATGPAQLGRPIKLSGRLSDILMDYFRVTHGGLGQAHAALEPGRSSKPTVASSPAAS